MAGMDQETPFSVNEYRHVMWGREEAEFEARRAQNISFWAMTAALVLITFSTTYYIL